MSFISVVAVMIELVGSFEGFEGLNASKARVLNWFRAKVINESIEVRDRGACIKERRARFDGFNRGCGLLVALKVLLLLLLLLL